MAGIEIYPQIVGEVTFQFIFAISPPRNLRSGRRLTVRTKEHGQTERALVAAVAIGFLELLNAIEPAEEKLFWEAKLTILKNTLTIR